MRRSSSSAFSQRARLARTRLAAVALVSLLLFGGMHGSARADGDPASDYLYVRSLFVPYGTSASKGAQKALATAIDEARRAGYPIRVALIERQSDLGAVTELWGRPRDYARFLDLELAITYKGPLLIVMPSGIGFAHLNRATAREYRTLAPIAVRGGKDGLALTAMQAVVALARQAGHPIAMPAVPTSTSSSGLGDRALAGGVALAVLLVAGGLFVLLRRRASGRQRRTST